MQANDRPTLVAWSLCLNVLYDSQWVDVQHAIRELRTSELPAPVRLEPGLCAECKATIDARRAAALAQSLREAA
jgi:hypothetical protein